MLSARDVGERDVGETTGHQSHLVKRRTVLSIGKLDYEYSRLSRNGHLYKTDTSVTPIRRTLSAGPKGVRLRES